MKKVVIREKSNLDRLLNPIVEENQLEITSCQLIPLSQPHFNSQTTFYEWNSKESFFRFGIQETAKMTVQKWIDAHSLKKGALLELNDSFVFVIFGGDNQIESAVRFEDLTIQSHRIQPLSCFGVGIQFEHEIVIKYREYQLMSREDFLQKFTVLEEDCQENPEFVVTQ